MWSSFLTRHPGGGRIGLFHARKKQWASPRWFPDSQVQVQGNYNAQNQLVANTGKFNGNSTCKTATDIQAGVTPVEQQEQHSSRNWQQQQAQLQATAAAIEGTTGAGGRRGQNRCQQGGHRRRQQALRRARQLQHPG